MVMVMVMAIMMLLLLHDEDEDDDDGDNHGGEDGGEDSDGDHDAAAANDDDGGDGSGGGDKDDNVCCGGLSDGSSGAGKAGIGEWLVAAAPRFEGMLGLVKLCLADLMGRPREQQPEEEHSDHHCRLKADGGLR